MPCSTPLLSETSVRPWFRVHLHVIRVAELEEGGGAECAEAEAALLGLHASAALLLEAFRDGVMEHVTLIPPR
jgi:hypothetical protein